jgi:hypothetical protein
VASHRAVRWRVRMALCATNSRPSCLNYSVRSGRAAIDFYKAAFGAVEDSAGAEEVYAVGAEHGWRLGRIADPFGHHWEIGTPLVAWPPSDENHESGGVRQAGDGS